jgi:hypothetical protein
VLANPYSRAGQKKRSPDEMVTKLSMQLTGRQRSAIYFKRHKGSECRAALFRQLRATVEKQTRDFKRKTVDNACLPQALRLTQLSLRGFGS